MDSKIPKKKQSHEMLFDKDAPHSQPWLKLLPPALHRKFQMAGQPYLEDHPRTDVSR